LVESLFQAREMAKRLYVGNLAYSVSSDDLQELFEQFGTVKTAQVLSDRETGRSRGFGFVEMDNDGDADAAIENLDGRDHQGRRLTVNEARPRITGGGSDTGGSGRGGYGDGRSDYGGSRGGAGASGY
jgi:cold-inducible RNA-binding protein